MSLAKSKTVCSGIEWNSMLGLLVRLKKDNKTIPYLLIGTGAYLGLRAKDLLNIRWIDILGKEEITVTESKTGKVRSITVNINLEHGVHILNGAVKTSIFIPILAPPKLAPKEKSECESES